MKALDFGRRHERSRALVRVLLMAALGSSVCLHPAMVPSAVAQDPDATARARELIKASNAAYEAQNFEEAYKGYSEALQLFPNPAILYRMGQTAEKLNRTKDATAHYQAIIRQQPDGELAQKANTRLEALKSVTVGKVALVSTPAGATVHKGSISSPALGRTPLTLEVEPGELTYFIVFPEHEPAKAVVRVEAGKTASVNLQLQELDPDRDEAEPVAMALADMPAEPRADTPTASGDGVVGLADVGSVPAPAPVVGPAAESASGGGLALTGWVCVGTGVAVLGTGGLFSYWQSEATQAVNAYDKAARGASQADLQVLKDDANSHYVTSLIAYGLGGALTATGIGLLVYEMGSSSTKSPDATALAGAWRPQASWAPGSVALSLSRNF